MNSLPGIGDRVCALVEDHWSKQGTPLLLSTLGSLEDGRISREARREHVGLRAFLERALAERLRVVEHSHQHTIVGAVPRTEATDEIEDWDQLLEKTRSDLALPRLHRALWAAFRKPIADGEERYVTVDERGVRFADVSAEHRPKGGTRVSPELIAGLDASDEDAYERATAWLEANDLDIERFRHSATSRDPHGLPANDLLGELIGALGTEDLGKISMPMDVVAKLRRHPS